MGEAVVSFFWGGLGETRCSLGVTTGLLWEVEMVAAGIGLWLLKRESQKLQWEDKTGKTAEASCD